MRGELYSSVLNKLEESRDIFSPEAEAGRLKLDEVEAKIVKLYKSASTGPMGRSFYTTIADVLEAVSHWDPEARVIDELIRKLRARY